jgi:VWFA-related protein
VVPVKFLAAWIVLTGLPCAPAHGEPRDSGLVERVGVELVEVHVLVTHRGRPVRGLTLDDFELRVDGKHRTLADVLEIGVESTPVDAASSAARSEPTPSRRDAPWHRPVFLVVYVDQWHVHPASRRWALDGVRRFLLELDTDETQVLVASFDGSVKIEQPFTHQARRAVNVLYDLERVAGGRQAEEAERQRLLRAMLRGAEAMPALDDAESHAESIGQRARVAIDALGAFVESMAGLDGLKVVLHVSDGLPRSPGQDLFVALERQAGSGFERMRAFRHDLTPRWEALARAANAAGVTVHTLDVRSTAADASASSEHAGLDPRSRTFVDAAHESNLHAPLRELATLTGGLALAGNQDLDGWLARVGADMETYYSLAFEAPQGSAFHEVEIRAKRPGLRVRHRARIRVADPTERLADGTRAALHFGIEQNPLGCSLLLQHGATGGPDRGLVPMQLHIPIARLTLLPGSNEHVARVTVAVAVQDELGRTTSPLLQPPFDVHVPSAELEQALSGHYTYAANLELRAGRQRVVVAVRDELSGEISLLERDVRVGRD